MLIQKLKIWAKIIFVFDQIYTTLLLTYFYQHCLSALVIKRKFDIREAQTDFNGNFISRLYVALVFRGCTCIHNIKH